MVCQGQETLHVSIGSTFTLNCSNDTSGIFNSLVWSTSAIRNGSMRTAYAYYSTGEEITNERFQNRLRRYNGASIQIKNAQRGDAGKYECNILQLYKVRDWGWDRNRLRVRVLSVYNVIIIDGPPVITKTSSPSLSFATSAEGSIFCDVKGTSPFNITWFKIGGAITTNVKFTEWTKVKDGVYKMRKHLKFLKFSSSNVGKYACTAQNSVGKVSKIIEVKLQVHPQIMSPSYVLANTGKTANLKCTAAGYPRVRFRWEFSTHNFKRVSLKPTQKIGRYHAMKTKHMGNWSSSVLRISRVQRQDWGVYYCIAENKAGFDEREIQLDGFSVPDTPSMLHSEKRTTRSIKLSWKLGNNGGKPIKLIAFEFKKSRSINWKTLKLSVVSEYDVLNLKPATFYDFRLTVINDIGESKRSNIYSVKTLPKVKSSPQNSEKKIIWGLNLVAVVGICAGVLIFLTCITSCSCFIYFERKHKRKMIIKRQLEKNENQEMNHYLIT